MPSERYGSPIYLTLDDVQKIYAFLIFEKAEVTYLVSALTGHVEGSRAFTRYRTIDIDMKKDLVKILEGKQ